MFMGSMKLDDRIDSHIPVHGAAQTYPDSYGVEIELEGYNIISKEAAITNWWTQHSDGSLRQLQPGSQAIEYVFNQPLPKDETEAAISALMSHLTSNHVEVFDSYRTSIHVHLNFSMEKFRTIYNFMVLSLILDELLTSQNGHHRIGNNFCLRAKDALGQVQSLIQSINTGNEFFNLAGNDRYSSINFVSLTKFGSIEFRSLECTTHKGRIMHWINTLAHIKKVSKTFDNPTEVISVFSKLGPKAFLQSVLGPFAMKYTQVPGYESMLHNGMRIAQDVAYSSAWYVSAPKRPNQPKLKKGAQIN